MRLDHIAYRVKNRYKTAKFFDNALGRTNLLFSDEYPDLDQIRKVYFKRLEGKIDLELFFDFFRWFDTSFSTMIEQLMPRRTVFLGVNFVVESHVFERHRFRYLFDEIYLRAAERDVSRGELKLSYYTGLLYRM